MVVAALVVGGVIGYFISPKVMTQQQTVLTAQDGDQVSVLYTGKLSDGTVFDASSKHGNQPFTFLLGAGQVIKGWDTGVVGMKVGDEKTLTIDPADGYGSQGIPDGKGGYLIPPNSTLIFDVKVTNIQRGSGTGTAQQ